MSSTPRPGSSRTTITKPIGTHTLTFGTRNEHVWLRNLFTQSSYGVWNFANLDSLAAGNANSFRKALILANGGNVEFSALQTAIYAQDQWQLNPNVALTFGLRMDMSTFLDDIQSNTAIQARTDAARVTFRSAPFSGRRASASTGTSRAISPTSSAVAPASSSAVRHTCGSRTPTSTPATSRRS